MSLPEFQALLLITWTKWFATGWLLGLDLAFPCALQGNKLLSNSSLLPQPSYTSMLLFEVRSWQYGDKASARQSHPQCAGTRQVTQQPPCIDKLHFRGEPLGSKEMFLSKQRERSKIKDKASPYALLLLSQISKMLFTVDSVQCHHYSLSQWEGDFVCYIIHKSLPASDVKFQLL